MNREPSVHITKSQFLQLLEELDIKAFPVDAFFRQAAKRALNTRAVVVTNKKTTKQVSKVLLASKGDTQLTADIIYAVRIQLKHRGVRKITEFHKRDWSLCKELTSICNQFAETYNFETTREAFIAYIKLGFERMGKNNRNWLPRLVSMSDNIFAYYDSLQETNEDDNFEATNSIYEMFNRKIADATGIIETEELKNNPETHLHFYQLRKLLESQGWDPEDFIDAQFEAMAWCNSIPEIALLYGPKAIERYKKYLYKHSNGKTSEPKVNGSIWDMMKKNG